jgi:hypothetical protein
LDFLLLHFCFQAAISLFLTTSHNANPALAWDVRVDVKGGANSIVLDQENAGPLQ